MDVDSVKKHLQEFFIQNPLVLIGSGLSLGEGISGMWHLSQYLKEEIPKLVEGDLLDEWKQVEDQIDKGVGFEDAMASLKQGSALVPFIVSETTKLISKDEKSIIEAVVLQEKRLAFSLLLNHLLHNQNELIIVTPNYDRLIELACETCGLDIITGFNGYYCGTHDPDGEKDKISVIERRRNLRGGSGVKVSVKKHAKIFKPHGSLDWYEVNGNIIRSPYESSARRLIITPGTSKFREGYQHPFDYHREFANKHIQEAKAILIVGYGFNDEQLEVHLLNKLREGVPTLVITKVLTPNAIRICDKLNNVTLVSVGSDDNETKIRIGGVETLLDANWWSLKEFITGVLI
ncbi:hypothetical protein OAG1_31560 [Agarivorans sp. OAG1]|uniref:SIR2 family protein n=1 Tax=Agarivorans sp. OAG1 TaxID=3082387 RepID=UPI002B2D22B3|nr:hypothetical protein OAG1_31560 [Agarivorans sp. OAG1]